MTKRQKMIGAGAIVLAVAVGGVTGCGSSGDDPASASSTSAAGSDLPQGSDHVTLDPAEFTTSIDNPYWPMAPGSKWVYREREGGAKLDVEVTVTDKTKVIDGIEARVVRDVVTENGVSQEVTDDYYAQDSEGNIWYLGEDTAEYKNGKPVSTHGSFEAGVDGAEGGIILPADPVAGLSYREEYYPGQAEDSASVLSLDEQAQVPAGHYANALMTSNVNPLEPKVQEYKFYAEGVGPVLTLSTSPASGTEELVSFTRG